MEVGWGVMGPLRDLTTKTLSEKNLTTKAPEADLATKFDDHHQI